MTSKKQFKIRLQPELLERLLVLHPSYGEAGRKVVELVRTYVESAERQRGKNYAVK